MNDRLSYHLLLLKDRLIANHAVQWLFLAASYVKAAWYRMRRNEFDAADALLYFSRILTVGQSGVTAPVPSLVRRSNEELVRKCIASRGSYLIDAYGRHHEARATLREFEQLGLPWMRSLKHPRPNDYPEREGDLLVLKPRIGHERGVLLIQYNGSLRRFVALYDVQALARHYRLVLEPSWWGYEDATILLYLGLNTDVIVQAQFEPDFNYISAVGHNFHAIRLGAGDWVDPEMFDYDPAIEKKYDVVMVANWQRMKRHAVLFKALQGIKASIGKVALVGYQYGGRRIADIEAEARQYGVADCLEFFEKVPPSHVGQLLQQSRVCVMLSRREGANRAIYEALFCNTPVIVSNANVGVNRSVINEQTGLFSSDEDLGANLLRVLARPEAFQPRTWAQAHTGYRHSSRRLNEYIRELAFGQGESWTADLFTKKNRPNSMFAFDSDRKEARRHLEVLGGFLRRPAATNPDQSESFATALPQSASGRGVQ